MISESIQDTKKQAQIFTEELSGTDTATVVGLHGDLGAGKTTFVQAVAEVLGVTEVITSPTFVIEKIYALENSQFERLIHIDAYRLEEGSDLVVLGWNAIVADPKNLILIEWPEKVKDVLPETMCNIDFEFVSETKRKINIHDKK